MSKYSRWFTISALLYLLLGAGVGLCMAVYPKSVGILRFSHIHIMMIGWVTMMIFGLGYHVIPRFCAHSLISDFWQGFNWWASNVGLVGMMLFPIIRFYQPMENTFWTTLFVISGLLQLVGIFIFTVTMLTTLQFKPGFWKMKSCCYECKS
ncbi:MAG: cbb3-type cytochrome c oxidase subunit I [Deltaproteobacteria bacterium]|nr:cbb3-type cytochrome c oxidase subunit I [Deltaproteobacteria bacterium]